MDQGPEEGIARERETIMQGVDTGKTRGTEERTPEERARGTTQVDDERHWKDTGRTRGSSGECSGGERDGNRARHGRRHGKDTGTEERILRGAVE
jgi:hypothetical protein